MRLYSAFSEETLRARKLLADWADEGVLTKTQYERLAQETVSDLRTTNIFLRLILFLFTLICVAATAGLFFKVFLSQSSNQTTGIFLLIFAVVCYVAAEIAASQAHLYRYGIEEALVVCSVGFLCGGMQAALFSGRPYSPKPDVIQCVVPTAGLAFSLWIWRRFGLWYAFLAAMIFAVFLSGCWTSSPSAQRVIVGLLYVIGLVCVIAARSGLEHNEDDYAIVEPLLWLGIYLAINLQLSSLSMRAQWLGLGIRSASEFPRSFYWSTWVLIWCLPLVVLARGVRRKDRFVIAAGAMLAILTFVSNKPYLGWPRHTWDPMLLGILLIGTAWLIRSWLALSPGAIRRGFISARLSGKDKDWMNVGSVAAGLAAPQSLAPTRSAEFRFGGGSSGGGGAGGSF